MCLNVLHCTPGIDHQYLIDAVGQFIWEYRVARKCRTVTAKYMKVGGSA